MAIATRLLGRPGRVRVNFKKFPLTAVFFPHILPKIDGFP